MVARSAQNPRHVVCKRVLGLEGDVVRIPSSQKWGGTPRAFKVKSLMRDLPGTRLLHAAPCCTALCKDA